MRIGHGYDVHRLVEDRKLILGGVEVKESYLVGQDLEAYFMVRLGE